MLVRCSDLGDIGAIEVVQSVDVLHDFLFVRSDSREDEQVLQVFVVREVAALQHDSLQQLNQLTRHVAVHERL